LKIPIPAIAIPVVVLLLYLFVPGVRQEPWTVLRIAGAVLAIAGYSLLMTARLQLGKSFAISPQAKELVTHGLYARIRNPIYVSVGIMWFGVILALRLYWLFLPLFALLVMQVFRVGKEAKVLEEKFGLAYLAYRKQTWF
jgi:protein-S-isoprenylcysteine O-methyltransferase Ste14